MGKKILVGVQFALLNFGPILAFYVVNHFYGLKPAIVVCAVYSIGEVIWAYFSGQELTNLFKFTAVMTLIFGVVDLCAQESFLFKYEAAVTNLLTGGFFGATVFGEKTMIQEFFEKSKYAKPVTPELAAYFRFFTLIWTAYFVVKAGIYFWVARHTTIEQGLIMRTLIGNGSFVIMLLISNLGGRRIFLFLRKLGFFQPKTMESAL